ncbi:MAG: tRNA-intron lyase [Sulfolobaceae archaeon]
MAHKGYLVGNRVIIPDIEASKDIYSKGFFGKPIGINKPKSVEDIKTPLELSLIEGLYLIRKKILEVYNLEEKLILEDEFFKYAKAHIENFELLYIVYEDLRNKGFVVRSGLKYGADFSVYTIGPGIEHAPYLVIVVNSEEPIKPNLITGFGRVSHSTRKSLVIAFVNPKTRLIRYTIFKWVKM